MIIREKYLAKIRPFYEQDLIKVITGIRRCGKSVILTQIIDELKNNGIKPDHIIYINFELKSFSFIKNDDDLDNYIKSKLKDKKKYYLFFDEIQNVQSWELAINSFKAELKDRVSIFITGSNSDLLSGELATHIAGRYVSFKVFPFTFKEVCELKNVNSKNKYELKELFDNYMLWGGMPQRFMMNDEEQTKIYLFDIYNSIVIKDIIENPNSIKNILRLEVQMYKLQDIRALLNIPMKQERKVNLIDVLNSTAKPILARFKNFGVTEEILKEKIEGWIENNNKEKTEPNTSKQLVTMFAAERYAEIIKENNYDIRRTKSHIKTEYNIYNSALASNLTSVIKENFWNFLIYRKPKAIRLIIDLLDKIHINL